MRAPTDPTAISIDRARTISSWWLLLTLVLGATLIPNLAAQRIGKIRWGFDQRGVIGRFNLLTVQVSNPTDRPIDKHLQLTRSFAGASKGAKLVQRCYLGAGSSRTLRFYPFVENANESWNFTWLEGGAGGKGAPGLTTGPPARVFLEKNSELNKRILISKFDPAALPTSAVAMEALGEIVLDRMPSLNKPQRVALLNWVRGGGIIHLLPLGGRYQDFPDELAVLNGVESDLAFGSGRVVRHGFERAQLRKKIPEEISGGFKSRFSGGESPVDQIRANLTEMIKTDHNWLIMFLLTIVYLVLIGPLFYKLSLQQLPWHLGLLGLSGVIGFATWMFMIIGARGYGEADSGHAIHFARPLGDGSFDVTTYANVFLTQGATRSFKGDSGFGLFSSAQVREQVGGQIVNGVQSSYEVDVPRFSHRLIIHKRRVVGGGHHFQYRHASGSVSTDLEIEAIAEVVGKEIYSWRPSGNRWVRGRAFEIRTWQVQHPYMSDGWRRVFAEVLNSRMGLALRDSKKPILPAGRHGFFILASGAPESFRLAGAPRSSIQRTIYHIDILE